MRAEPQQLPPVFADERAAWEGFFPESPDTPLRVEAAALRGRPVLFEARGPWRACRLAQPAEPDGGSTRFYALLFAVFMLVTVTGVALARRNWRLGRGDRRGAFRVVARLGLLAMASVQFFYFMGQLFPYTTDLSAWYAGGTLFGVAFCAAVAAYCFHTSLAGRPLLRAEQPD